MLYIVPADGFGIGSLEIKYYGLIMAVAMLVGVLLACRLAKKRNIKSDDIFLLALIILPCAILGARIYYCTFYEQSYTFKEFFNFKEGGLAVLGGVIGGIVGIFIFALIKRDFKMIIDLLDICAPCLILGQAIGRIGCFFSQCCYGELVTNSSHCWFPLAELIENVDGSYSWHYATNLYESAWNLLGFVPVLFVYQKGKEKLTSTATYLVWYGVGRAVIEGFRGDSLFVGGSNVRVSQVISIVMAIIGVALLVYNFVRRRKHEQKV